MPIKNAADLRDRLAENFMSMRAGELTHKDAEAMTNISGKMIASSLAQLKMYQQLEEKVEIAFLKEPETEDD